MTIRPNPQPVGFAARAHLDEAGIARAAEVLGVLLDSEDAQDLHDMAARVVASYMLGVTEPKRSPAVLQMRKVCCYCQRLMQAGHEPTSHGCCDACLAEQRAKLAARRAQPEPELPVAPAGRAERCS